MNFKVNYGINQIDNHSDGLQPRISVYKARINSYYRIICKLTTNSTAWPHTMPHEHTYYSALRLLIIVLLDNWIFTREKLKANNEVGRLRLRKRFYVNSSFADC